MKYTVYPPKFKDSQLAQIWYEKAKVDTFLVYHRIVYMIHMTSILRDEFPMRTPEGYLSPSWFLTYAEIDI